MKINFKKLFFYIIVTFLIGNFFTIFINNTNIYNNLNIAIKVPSIIFPIVWSILYLVMGVSAYIVSQSIDIGKESSIKLYFLQLLVNSLWTLLFFGLKLYVISFIWLLLLLCLVTIMLVKFYHINKWAGLLNIPYFIWLIFAGFLSLSVVILN